MGDSEVSSEPDHRNARPNWLKLNLGHSRRPRQVANRQKILERVPTYHHCQQSLRRAVKLSDYMAGCYRGRTGVHRALHRRVESWPQITR